MAANLQAMIKRCALQAAKLKIVNVLPTTQAKPRDPQHAALSRMSLDDDR
jgi:hypothetical protein